MTAKSYVNDALDAEANNPDAADPLFVFQSKNGGWTSTQEPPRETDILVFENGGAGHFVITMAAVPKTDALIWVPIVEENVAKLGDYGPLGSLVDSSGKAMDPYCHHRVLKGTKSGSKWVVDSGIGYTYTGFIRHNLAGIYGDTGWRDDGTSQLFRDVYLKYGTKLGWAFSDHNGTPFVHRVHNVWLQNFRNTDPNNHFGTDGETILVLSPEIGAAGPPYVHLIKEGFFGAYKCIPGSDSQPMGGAEYLGSPQSDELQGRIDGNCRETTDTSVPIVTYQMFDRGCLWWRDAVDGKVHIHIKNGTQVNANAATACGVQVENNPPGADCTDDCSPGTQVCNPDNSVNLRICGHPGPDTCYHWLNMSCASGLVCRSGNCVSATSSTGSGGAAQSSGGSPSVVISTGGTSSIGPSCAPYAQNVCPCSATTNGYQVCSADGRSYGACQCPSAVTTGGTGSISYASGGAAPVATSTGGTAVATISAGGAMIVPPSTGGRPSSTGGAPVQVTLTGGVAQAPPSTGGIAVISTGGRPPSTGGAPVQVISTGGIAVISTGGTRSSSGGSPSTGGVMAATGGTPSTGGIPSATGGSPTASASSSLRLVYTSPMCGSLHVEAWWTNIDNTNRAWAPITECVDANPADCTLDCILPVPSGTPYLEFQAYAPNNEGYGNEDCYNGGCGKPLGELHLYKGSSEIPFKLVPNPAGPPYYNEVLQPVP